MRLTVHLSIQNLYSQKGFSLIEALVAFLVLSVGMLGIASLQTMSIKAGHTASLRSVAVVKVEEIMERMRSNRTALPSYIVSTSGTGTNHGCDDLSGSVKSCTDVEMAQYDVFQWKQGLTEALPPNVTTTGSIAVISPGAVGQGVSTVTVTVNWQERNPDSQAMVNMNYSATANLCGATTC